jgi:hypothetical protein
MNDEKEPPGRVNVAVTPRFDRSTRAVLWLVGLWTAGMAILLAVLAVAKGG